MRGMWALRGLRVLVEQLAQICGYVDCEQSPCTMHPSAVADCPWCDIRSTHAGYAHVHTKLPTKDKKKHDRACLVKGRNEPCNIRQVAEVLAGARGDDTPEQFAALCDAIYANTTRMFFQGN